MRSHPPPYGLPRPVRAISAKKNQVRKPEPCAWGKWNVNTAMGVTGDMLIHANGLTSEVNRSPEDKQQTSGRLLSDILALAFAWNHVRQVRYVSPVITHGFVNDPEAELNDTAQRFFRSSSAIRLSFSASLTLRMPGSARLIYGFMDHR
ncbi:hypothetical protein MJO29_008765 [Puccinia striiformis f. sp. tritici]|nr:hypothetical protein MJO29_008765 [Puccinia striiformis f. sp. tritici]